METVVETKRKEIYTYVAPWTTYALGWSRRGTENDFRLAVGSFKEEYSNQLQVIQLQKDDDGLGRLNKISEFDHPYIATKVMWSPSTFTGQNELLATTGDYLRLWSVNSDNSVEIKSLLNNNRHSEYCAPLTSFDWNDDDPNLIGTCSVDTTCTMWDVTKMVAKTQLIAHDKEVYDISFASGSDIFATVGADGSVRMFDLRSLEHSTILYETADLSPLLRVAWNKIDNNYLATIQTSSPKTVIIDIRMPSIPCVELLAHQAAVNGLAWAPHSSCHLCTCSDDH
ncbi:wdr68, partial [Symbiodinium microadriaticum]